MNLYERVEKSLSEQDILTWMGAKLEVAEVGKVVISCDWSEHISQQDGFLHGGVVATLADVAAGHAAYSTIPADGSVLTVEMKINYIRPAASKKIIATGEVLKTGRHFIVTETTLTDEKGTLIAKMSGTVFPLLKDNA